MLSPSGLFISSFLIQETSLSSLRKSQFGVTFSIICALIYALSGWPGSLKCCPFVLSLLSTLLLCSFILSENFLFFFVLFQTVFWQPRFPMQFGKQSGISILTQAIQVFSRMWQRKRKKNMLKCGKGRFWPANHIRSTCSLV